MGEICARERQQVRPSGAVADGEEGLVAREGARVHAESAENLVDLLKTPLCTALSHKSFNLPKSSDAPVGIPTTSAALAAAPALLLRERVWPAERRQNSHHSIMPLASPSACVVIKGVPQGTTAGDLERILQDYGEVRVRMGRHDRLEGARGIGPCFVEFASVDLAQAFVEGSIADFEVRTPPRPRSAAR